MKLAIDPGHGYANIRPGVYDPGACSSGVTEADIALQWALTLRWVAAQLGLPTWMTRDDDSDATPVGSRDDRAELAGCSHFLSLHCNAASWTARGSALGSEAYYRDAADKPFAESVLLATVSAMKTKDRGVKTESQSQHPRLAVLGFKGPATLLEIGFITNEHDREQMLRRDVRVAWAKAVVGLLR